MMGNSGARDGSRRGAAELSRTAEPGVTAGYPITPASDGITTTIAKYKNFNIVTFQSEDEIAAICSAIGASYRRQARDDLLRRAPGIALKSEAINLAVMTELPACHRRHAARVARRLACRRRIEQSDLLQCALSAVTAKAPMPIDRDLASPSRRVSTQLLKRRRIAVKLHDSGFPVV
jgi:hypothetical protein